MEEHINLNQYVYDGNHKRRVFIKVFRSVANENKNIQGERTKKETPDHFMAGYAPENKPQEKRKKSKHIKIGQIVFRGGNGQ